MIGFVPDTPLLYEKLTAVEYLRFVADLRGIPREETDRKGVELLRLFDLAEVAHDLIDTFSHGMKQKTALAGALVSIAAGAVPLAIASGRLDMLGEAGA
ncbi:MAG TPA: hypothetical protein VMN57_09130 [Anaerolineales bacterium]|nr:hypothetical protein [Anaerolineales bacterium]